MQKVTNYLREVREELKKVHWPKKYDAAKLTLTVVIISVFVGIYLGSLDYLFARALELLLTSR